MRSIGHTELQVGQWIHFSASESDLKDASSKQKAIYKENRFFLVISREDFMFDSCRCYLIDISGERFDYCPRMHSIEGVDRIWYDSVMVVPKEVVIHAYGEEQTNNLYTKALEHLAKMKGYFDKYSAKLLAETAPRERVQQATTDSAGASARLFYSSSSKSARYDASQAKKFNTEGISFMKIG